jgi:hypothetical protein
MCSGTPGVCYLKNEIFGFSPMRRLTSLEPALADALAMSTFPSISGVHFAHLTHVRSFLEIPGFPFSFSA